MSGREKSSPSKPDQTCTSSPSLCDSASLGLHVTAEVGAGCGRGWQEEWYTMSLTPGRSGPGLEQVLGLSLPGK